MQYDIFSVGDNVADYYPEQKKIYAGGGAYNTAVLAKRAGSKAAYYGTFGTDENAKFLYQALRKERVAYPVNDIREGLNAVSIIKKVNGESSVEKVDKGVYKGLKIGKSALDLIKNSKIVHSNIYSYFEDYLKKIHYKTKISFDFSHLRNMEYIQEIMKRVDIAFFSGVEADGDPYEFLNRVSELGAEAVILTRGAEGALMKFDGEITEREADSAEIIDTLGAGDAFIAGFLSSAVDDSDYKKALDNAVKSAANNCSINGSLGIFEKRKKDIIIHRDYHHEYL